ncbi:putative E3 ubiquitin-protein ligase XBAT35 [Andrographis paniculata]|uniref:putative E3 ubiquitin-protein ligase XBAT35 n=1 Tax=Andrographis paniculata TaxID=175694 RepID=UPI0021E71FD7|nr:putative E3 ubiquitin-protein ligase XBAT35 [Andrographis paniculata]
MGQQQSKDELLYQQVSYGNVEGIKALRSQGAGLEWIDREGKTALIAACMNPVLYNVANTLIELGANVNAYRPGRHAGTPLHHAAKRGLEKTVKLLLSHGANALIMNDDCQTALDVARAKGYCNVVRAIEEHLCLFSGWLRELYGPGFLELLAPQLLSRRVWVVILPCGSRNIRKPLKLELAVYAGAQDPQPRTVIPLWKANLTEPNFNLPDPAAVISDFSRNTLIKLTPTHESEKHQLQRFCNACKGIPQVIHPTFPQAPTAPADPSNPEDAELTMAINASLASTHETLPHTNTYVGSGADASTSAGNSQNPATNQENYDVGTSSKSKCQMEESCSVTSTVPAAPENPSPAIPSAPPADGPIEYPSIDASPIDIPSSSLDAVPDEGNGKKDDAATLCCTICLDAPLEGACVPCGHLAGCMSCLTEVKGKKWGCPVCRANIDQVIRIYSV